MAHNLPKPWKRLKKDGSFDWYITIRENGRQKQVFLAPPETPDEKLQELTSGSSIFI